MSIRMRKLSYLLLSCLASVSLQAVAGDVDEAPIGEVVERDQARQLAVRALAAGPPARVLWLGEEKPRAGAVTFSPDGALNDAM